MPMFYKFHTYSDGYWNPIGSGYDSYEEAAKSALELWGKEIPNDTVIGFGVEEIPDDDGPSIYRSVEGLKFVHPTKMHFNEN